MAPDFTLYGLNFPELIFFGILLYVIALILVLFIIRCMRYRTFCPFSGDGVHCTYIKCPQTCPSCSLKPSSKSVFCCDRKHSLYNLDGCGNIPKCKLEFFSPNCKYLRFCCCELFLEEEDDFIPQKTDMVML